MTGGLQAALQVLVILLSPVTDHLSSCFDFSGFKTTFITVQPKEAPMPSLVDKLLFFPAKYPEGDWKPQGLKFEDVYFETQDKVKLHGWYCPVDKPKAIVMFAHGNAGNLSHRAHTVRQIQASLQATVFIFDYRGYGRSEGAPTIQGAIDDGIAARKWLSNKTGLKPDKLILLGRSLGGAVVTQLAAKEKPRALILESTFSSLKDIAKHHYAALSFLVPAKDFNSAEAIKKYQGPLLLSHGDADEIVPYKLGVKLFDAANQPKEMFKVQGGDHNGAPPQEYYKHLKQFIEELED